MERLKFQKGNAKIDKDTLIFSLPAGWSCPGALSCKSKVKNGKVIDGLRTQFRCYAASDEARHPNTYKARQHNYKLLKSCNSVDQMVHLIIDSIWDYKPTYVRIHASGDFYNESYFKAWCEVARITPQVVFYAYTKSIPFIVKHKDIIPANLVITASFGGKHDDLINKYKLKHCLVVYSEEEAEAIDYPIDHDDSWAKHPTANFALLLHGVQPKGSTASKALTQLRKKGIRGYAR
jgi:hypothetical protein